jgi:hypothetical protein
MKANVSNIVRRDNANRVVRHEDDLTELPYRKNNEKNANDIGEESGARRRLKPSFSQFH